MLCPNCGTKAKTDHKFCRNCGMNLEPVSRALAAHHAHGAAAAQLAREADRRSVKKLTGGLLAGVIVVLFGVLMMTLPGKGFQLLGLFSALLGIVYSLASITSALRRMGDAGAEALPPALDNTAPDTGRLLHEQTFEHVTTSVTDHTTELLNVEAKGAKSRRDD
ncbi:MAG TPA: zinc ribbon domain-containing protein [Pyrinomonadaceae bacterium]|jgi:predicted lipid-binding transport protein (Tim44 family)